MRKRGSLFVFNICISEIILIISISFSLSFILNNNLVNAQGNPVKLYSPCASCGGYHEATAEQIAATAKGQTPAAPPAGGEGPLEGIKAGVGKVFSGEATLGATGSTGAFVGTLIGALAWAGVAYAVVQIIGSLLGVDKGVL